MTTLREHLTEISFRHHWKGMQGQGFCMYCSQRWPCPDNLDAKKALEILNAAPSVGITPALTPHPGWRELFDPNHPEMSA